MSSEKSHKRENFSIGSRLKTAREKRHLTTEQLAKKTGIPKSTINNAENGRAIKPDNLCKIIQELGLNSDWVLFGLGDPFGISTTSPASEDPRLVRLTHKAWEVLISSHESIAEALASNINAFHEAIQKHEEVRRLELTVQTQNSKIDELELRLGKIERNPQKAPSAGTGTGT